MQAILREILAYIIFLYLLYSISYGSKDPMTWRMYRNLQNSLEFGLHHQYGPMKEGPGYEFDKPLPMSLVVFMNCRYNRFTRQWIENDRSYYSETFLWWCFFNDCIEIHTVSDVGMTASIRCLSMSSLSPFPTPHRLANSVYLHMVFHFDLKSHTVYTCRSRVAFCRLFNPCKEWQILLSQLSRLWNDIHVQLLLDIINIP